MSPQSRPCLEPANSPMPLWFPLHRCLSCLAPPSAFFLDGGSSLQLPFPSLSLPATFPPFSISISFLAEGKEIHCSFCLHPHILGNFLFSLPTCDIPGKSELKPPFLPCFSSNLFCCLFLFWRSAFGDGLAVKRWYPMFCCAPFCSLFKPKDEIVQIVDLGSSQSKFDLAGL